MARKTQRLRQPSADLSKHQPLLKSETTSQEITRARMPVGELAGGTAAECAAVCCCCPLTVVNLLVLATYKAPACLCRMALDKKRRQRVMNRQCKGLLYQRPNSIDITYGQDYLSETPITTSRGATSSEEIKNEKEIDTFVEMEKEMWPQLYGAGFGRSLSQKFD